jgi:hypothetical protein
MQKIAYAVFGVLSLTLALAAQNYSECQAPNAHMNPKCNGSGTPSAPPKADFAVGGTYQLTGTSPEGGKYEGSVVVTGDAQNGYQFNWTVGADQYQGTGTLAGDTVTVDWGAPEPAVYKILSGGALLQGKWGKKGRGRETLKR